MGGATSPFRGLEIRILGRVDWQFGGFLRIRNVELLHIDQLGTGLKGDPENALGSPNHTVISPR